MPRQHLWKACTVTPASRRPGRRPSRCSDQQHAEHHVVSCRRTKAATPASRSPRVTNVDAKGDGGRDAAVSVAVCQRLLRDVVQLAERCACWERALGQRCRFVRVDSGMDEGRRAGQCQQPPRSTTTRKRKPDSTTWSRARRSRSTSRLMGASATTAGGASRIHTAFSARIDMNHTFPASGRAGTNEAASAATITKRGE